MSTFNNRINQFNEVFKYSLFHKITTVVNKSNTTKLHQAVLCSNHVLVYTFCKTAEKEDEDIVNQVNINDRTPLDEFMSKYIILNKPTPNNYKCVLYLFENGAFVYDDMIEYLKYEIEEIDKDIRKINGPKHKDDDWWEDCLYSNRAIFNYYYELFINHKHNQLNPGFKREILDDDDKEIN